MPFLKRHSSNSICVLVAVRVYKTAAAYHPFTIETGSVLSANNIIITINTINIVYSCPSIFVFFLCRRNGNGPIYAHQSAVHTAAATQGSKDNPIMSESYFSVY